jgi:hypothetical protein
VLEEHYRLLGQLDPAELFWQDWIYGLLDVGEGKLDDARTRVERFADHARSQDDQEAWWPWAALALATYWLVAGDAGAAYQHYSDVLAARRRQRDEVGIADCLHKLGFAAQQQGNTSLATQHLRESLTLGWELENRDTITAALAGCAGVALTDGMLERAARLCGQVEALQKLTRGFDPEQHIIHQRNLSLLRERLDPATLQAHWAEGRAISLEQAISEALGEAPS